MTQRDQKIVLMLVLGLVGLGAAFMAVQSWFLGPLAKYNNDIAALATDVTAKNQQIAGILRDRKLLDKARLLSLPVSQKDALEKYDAYLHKLLSASGLTELDVQEQPPADIKATSNGQTQANGAKKPEHKILTFQVRAKGNLASVVSALENLRRTPVMHRVRGLTLTRKENSAKDLNKDNLNVQMTIEAMIVAGAKKDFTPTLRPDTSVALPTESHPRRYSDIARKNIFTGPLPPVAQKGPSPEIAEFDESIPGFVLLDHTEPTSQEAFLITRVFRMPETRLRAKKGSGYDTFRIMNEDRTKVLVKARVMRVDQRDVYFQVKDDVYGVHIGHSIADAMRRPLSDQEIKGLNLTSLVQDYDPKADKEPPSRNGRSNRGFSSKGPRAGSEQNFMKKGRRTTDAPGGGPRPSGAEISRQGRQPEELAAPNKGRGPGKN